MVDNNQSQVNNEQNIVDSAVADGGAYEIIRKRLIAQSQQLQTQIQQLNDNRLEEFGGSDMEVMGRVRVRTDNNCIARDMVQVGEYLVFGYNVFIGLKKETQLRDVFSLFCLQETEGVYSLEPFDITKSFFYETSFKNDFDELYRYYKTTKLVQLTVKNSKLLASFQIGERADDVRVFRWQLSPDGSNVQYIDNRGERDIELPPAYDFEWQSTSREDIVHGKHAHINIQDIIFVETIGGDLTIKIENNTEDGLGIYREKVEDKTQSLDDAEIEYAQVGDLIILKVLPYRETQWRYLIYNTLTQSVLREDALGESCISLPEDHGIIFPGGYYLQTGEYKRFDEDTSGFKFKQMQRSPNGEDVLFVFYKPENGTVGLFAYNIIDRQLQNPILGHGYALSENGVLVIFSAEQEATRIHPMQIWQTPYVSTEYAANMPSSQSFLGKVGNAELVRGISDFFSIVKLINNQTASLKRYEELSRITSKVFDTYFWLSEEELTALADVMRQVSSTSELVIDEFAKVQSIQAQSAKAMREAESGQQDLLQSIRPENWEKAEEFVEALAAIRGRRGQLVTIKSLRYINVDKIELLEAELLDSELQLSEHTVDFLSNEKSLEPYFEKIETVNNDVASAESIAQLNPIIEIIENTAAGLDLLSELMATLKVSDVTIRTRIIDAISEVYAKLNQSKANARHRHKALGSSEATAQFSAQFKLFTQSITNALGMSDSPERCDEQLSRLLVQLEELESQFTEHDEFLNDIMEKRDEVYESFESRKQQLLDERQRKAQSISDAASRILSSIEKRSLKYSEADKLNTYFAADTLVLKVRELVVALRSLDAAVKADDIESKFSAIKEQALRSLRDKTDIYEDGGNIIKLGPRHKFSVNTQELDLTIIPRNDQQYMHLTGTDYFEKINSEELISLQSFWQMNSESETAEVYRAEYLAYQILSSAEQGDLESCRTINELVIAAKQEGELLKIVRDYSAPLYKEGYEKGVHDADATSILQSLLPKLQQADVLRFSPLSRGFANIFWANLETVKAQKIKISQAKNTLSKEELELLIGFDTWQQRAQSATQMRSIFSSTEAINQLAEEIFEHMQGFVVLHPIAVDEDLMKSSAYYLVEELARPQLNFLYSQYAVQLLEEFKRSLSGESWSDFEQALQKMLGWPAQRWALTTSWLEAFVVGKGFEKMRRYIPEAVALINSEGRLDKRFSELDIEVRVSQLIGDHASISDRSLHFSLDNFLQRLEHHKNVVIPKYQRYQILRQSIAETEKSKLRLDEFKPRPLSSFVRNRLVNESYLPIIGDNLAKQMGTVGENKRSDLMGLLMMISPPGYGKTTLMEYVANRLGLIFMKINCPSLGHDVMSLDPEQAPNATAKQELIKINLGFEMGSNVMLYLDDIQHTHPEFLQKFISLCDGTRRIDGVWKGNTKTYDMRGKKFCVVMAGNPYTESGEAFKVPDMLANRADIYNLGDILGGMDEQFALSYIENSLTSNAVLAPLAVRDMQDVYKLVDMAKGKHVATTDLSHQYSSAEINEIIDVLKKMFVIQDVILKINQQYIASAAQDDSYRTEPSFKLQGSYRNMNKMAEKISAVMNEDELMQMIADHYLGEAQLLTTGAEANLLKLAELRGNMTAEQEERWTAIKSDYLRNKAMGGDDADVGSKVVAQLVDLVNGVKHLGEFFHDVESAVAKSLFEISDKMERQLSLQVNDVTQKEDVQERLPVTIDKASLRHLAKVLNAAKSDVNVVNQPVPGIDKILSVLAQTIEHSIFPLVRSMDKKLDIDLKTHDKMKDISLQLRELEDWAKKTNGV